jgi:hypothetical protein
MTALVVPITLLIDARSQTVESTCGTGDAACQVSRP